LEKDGCSSSLPSGYTDRKTDLHTGTLPLGDDDLLRRNWKILALGALLLPAALHASAQISFYTAVDLAVRNSHEVKMAEADVRRAVAGLQESRDVYIPSLAFGSGLGYSYGFPVGQPTVFNGSAQSLLLSFSQPAYIRSAHASVDAAQDALKDTRQKVIAEAALEYFELDADQHQLDALEQQHAYGERLVQIEQDRQAAGFSSPMDVTRARLSAAQLELKQLHLRNHADLLRARLGNLTGLSVDGIATEPASLPKPPDFASGQQLLAQARNGNFAIQAADASARSKFDVAYGDQRQNLRPQISFGLQYSRFAKFNNYELYYLRFQHNNFEVGVNITVPLFNATSRAHARGSSADAAHAQEQANLYRQQVSEQTLELDKSLSELALQQKVAGLQSDLARQNLQAITTQLQTGGSTGTVLTPKDEELAKIEERQRYTEMLDAKFQLIQAQLNLLRSIGGVEEWALQAPPH
jgi:outer membrane protein TolC